ncbi:MAG: hypothetical protein BA861_02270 [Desulfobacterales bacterium S3730MH5]|nr:MAG: hypothetical protein BA861_02270 [Desulfobacterales bacterium S3730MH5]OEU83867.1 MAG: hypothetical protein BA865_02680 [Desulfobacterales bacterium S5133MH4]
MKLQDQIQPHRSKKWKCNKKIRDQDPRGKGEERNIAVICAAEIFFSAGPVDVVFRYALSAWRKIYGA